MQTGGKWEEQQSRCRCFHTLNDLISLETSSQTADVNVNPTERHRDICIHVRQLCMFISCCNVLMWRVFAVFQLYRASALFETIRHEMQHSTDYKLSLFDLQTSSYQALQRVLVSLGELTVLSWCVVILCCESLSLTFSKSFSQWCTNHPVMSEYVPVLLRLLLRSNLSSVLRLRPTRWGARHSRARAHTCLRWSAGWTPERKSAGGERWPVHPSDRGAHPGDGQRSENHGPLLFTGWRFSVQLAHISRDRYTHTHTHT